MTYPNDCTLPTEVLEQLASQGLNQLPEMICILVNAAMQAERPDRDDRLRRPARLPGREPARCVGGDSRYNRCSHVGHPVCAYADRPAAGQPKT